MLQKIQHLTYVKFHEIIVVPFILDKLLNKALSTRIYQPKYNVRNVQENSSIIYYHHEYNHPVSWENESDIFFLSNFLMWNLLEIIFIKIIYDKNMNLSQ